MVEKALIIFLDDVHRSSFNISIFKLFKKIFKFFDRFSGFVSELKKSVWSGPDQQTAQLSPVRSAVRLHPYNILERKILDFTIHSKKNNIIKLERILGHLPAVQL